jgi:lysyl endopeptidase
MPSVRCRGLSGLLALSAFTTAVAGQPPRMHAEPSRTPAQKQQLAWRATDAVAVPATRLHYGEMSARRILALRDANTVRTDKPLQIGIAREAAGEARSADLPPLRWMTSADGSSVARIELLSPLAYGIRAGLDVSRLDPRAELRFAGSARPDVVLATLTGAQARARRGDDGLYWTPATDGETQLIELWLPADASPADVQLRAPRLSHLMTNALDDFKILKNVGASDTCNIDTVCRVGQLGQTFVNAKAAVARMIFVLDGGSYYCTGTLLNDTDPATQVPLFHTAHHCIPTQSVAITLNTYWNFESTACDVDAPASYTMLNGGADYLYSSESTDGALLRLRDNAPAGATFAGWDANVLPASSAVTAIHHPAGDLKKVSFGQHLPGDSTGGRYAAGWLQGTTEGGSSGSGLFTVGSGGYYLRGGLYGGSASCANSGALGNAGNVDWYSRFDVDFPSIRQYLMPAPAVPRRRNGSQPLRAP